MRKDGRKRGFCGEGRWRKSGLCGKLTAVLCICLLTGQTAAGQTFPAEHGRTAAGQTFPVKYGRASEVVSHNLRQGNGNGKKALGSINWVEGKVITEIPAYSAGVDLIYNGKKIDSSKTPVIHVKGVDLVPIRPLLCEKGPKASFEESITGHIRLTWKNHLVTGYIGERTLYASGWEKKLDAPVMMAHYAGSSWPQRGTDCIVAPVSQICEALGLKCEWDEQKGAYILTGKAPSFPGKTTKTPYAYSRKDFTWKEYTKTRQASYQVYEKMIDPGRDTTHGFQFLRIDEYREPDWENFEQYYQYLIEDYCRENKLKARNSVLYGRADMIREAAEAFDLDPIYFANQTFLESGYGTSELARGKTISRVAPRDTAKWSSYGKLRTRALKKKVKVYNLYGIKAIDADPVVGGTSYAYYEGWTTPKKAIFGAAEYISKNYVHGEFHQNTVYKMRYTFRKSIWHQYALDPRYAQKIGQRIYLMSSCYGEDAAFLYDYPQFQNQ